MVAKAQGQELRKGVLGSLLRNLSTAIGLKLLLLPREQRLHVDEPLGPSWQRWRPRQYERGYCHRSGVMLIEFNVVVCIQAQLVAHRSSDLCKGRPGPRIVCL